MNRILNLNWDKPLFGKTFLEYFPHGIFVMLALILRLVGRGEAIWPEAAFETWDQEVATKNARWRKVWLHLSVYHSVFEQKQFGEFLTAK